MEPKTYSIRLDNIPVISGLSYREACNLSYVLMDLTYNGATCAHPIIIDADGEAVEEYR